MKRNFPASIFYSIFVAFVIFLGIGFFAIAHADVISGSSANSGSSSSVRTNTNSAAFNAGNSQSTTFNSPSDMNIRNVPALGSLALGGGHPCAYSPATGQLSIFGGGIGVGGMKVDDACMLMVMGVNDPRAKAAAEYMIAARSPDACAAMAMYGIVGGCQATSGWGQTKPAQRPANLGNSGLAGVSCDRNAKGQVTVVHVPGEYNETQKATAVAWCQKGN